MSYKLATKMSSTSTFGAAKNIKRLPETIDQLIIDQVEKATAENSDIWTCPDFNRREYAHSFFQYPAMMIPAVQRKLIEIIKNAKPETQKMIDPFIGSATSIIASMESGLDCYGQDINPLAVLISKTRTGPYNIEETTRKYFDLLDRVKVDKSKANEAKPFNIHKWFKPKISIELSKLVRAIRQEPKLTTRRFFWVILAETVRLTSNDRTSTFKLHARKNEEIDARNFSAINVFEQHMEQSLVDLQLHALLLDESNVLEKDGGYKRNVQVSLLNSKVAIASPKPSSFFDLLVTSPPYGDNKTTVTYGQHSYLPLQWIDLTDIDPLVEGSCLKTTSEIDSRSLGGKIKGCNKEMLNHLNEISQSFRKTCERIRQANPKQLPKVVSFIADLNSTLDNVFKVMKPNSYQVWTIGNRRVAKQEIPNDAILCELIESKGGILIKKITREIINKRMAKRNNNATLMNNEDILIFRKIG